MTVSICFVASVCVHLGFCLSLCDVSSGARIMHYYYFSIHLDKDSCTSCLH
jgi:hypothetical protein